MIMDSKKRPLPKATVEINKKKINLEENGKFQVFLPTGVYDFKVVLDGFQNKTSTLEVKAHQKMEVSVILESLDQKPLHYHSYFQIEDILNSLAVNYSQIARSFV